MQIALSKTREQFPLSPKKPLKKTIAAMIGWFILFIILYVILIAILFFTSLNSSVANPTNQFNSLPIIGLVAAVILALFFIIFVVTYIYQKWYYQVYFYDLTDSFIIIKKGVITPKEITIPYERVQDVYVDQDIFDRMFGLYDVHLSSATISSGMEAHIDGVEKQAADGLREVLLQTVHEKISKNKNQNNIPNNPTPST